MRIAVVLLLLGASPGMAFGQTTPPIVPRATIEEVPVAAAVNLFGARGTIEIAALAGDYLMMTTVYNALGLRLRSDQQPTLPHRAGAPVGAEWR